MEECETGSRRGKIGGGPAPVVLGTRIVKSVLRLEIGHLFQNNQQRQKTDLDVSSSMTWNHEGLARSSNEGSGEIRLWNDRSYRVVSWREDCDCVVACALKCLSHKEV